MKWTDEDKQTLVQLVEQHTVNKRIQWAPIAEQLRRGVNQCKAMYIIQLGLKKLGVTQRWSNSDVMELVMLVSHYGQRWTFLQKNYYPSRTKEQVRQKYLNSMRCYSDALQVLQTLMDEEKFPSSKDDLNCLLSTLQKFKTSEEQIEQFAQDIQQEIPVQAPDPLYVSFMKNSEKSPMKVLCEKYTIDDYIAKVEAVIQTKNGTLPK